ncbi:MAG TPA: inosine/xanthosine triphosphatase [Candidatus Nitrosotenuis sp.]|nr:inosine/xanthosine triphosphatase [Candidatus Nitrosotenuis sp.]
MRKVFVAVGTKRRPKLNAVWEALTFFGPVMDPDAQYEVVSEQVPSGVGHTPLTRDELMSGARQRAEALRELARERSAPWSFFVGLEGGFEVFQLNGQRLVFLQSWAYVCDAQGRGAFGQSGAIPVPDALVRKVVDEGVELAEAIDAFAGEEGVRDQQGAWGVFTRNLITRQDSFRTAVINAFAPFFNRTMYERS